MLGSPLYLARFLQGLPHEARFGRRIVSLFRKAWEAMPDERYVLITYLRRDEIWQMPEIYGYVREVILPQGTARTGFTPWYPFMPSTPLVADDRTRPPVIRLLDVAASQGKLDELTEQVLAARKQHPDWVVGDALLALIRSRTGHHDDLRELVRRLIDRFENDKNTTGASYTTYACWTMGLELESHPATRDLAIMLYECACRQPYAYVQYYLATDRTLIQCLVDLCVAEGCKADARRALIEHGRLKKLPNGMREELANLLRMKALADSAQRLVALGFAADAVSLYGEAMALAEVVDTSTPALRISNIEQLPGQIREGLNRAIAGMRRDELAPIAGRLIADAGADRDPNRKGRAAQRDQALDLLMVVYPRELDGATLRSLFADSLAACDARQLAALDGSLDSLRKAHLDDFSVAIAVALKELVTGDMSRIGSALDRLGRLIELNPLEPLPQGARANARQRAEAAPQVPLWLVTRACWKQGSSGPLHELGDRLAALAIEAAGRQADNHVLLAILREQGELALSRGDRAGAEKTWGKMLESVIPRPKPDDHRPRTRPEPTRQPAPVRSATAPTTSSIGPLPRDASLARSIAMPLGAANLTLLQQALPQSKGRSATPKAARPAPAARRPRTGPGNVPVLTLDRLEQAMQIARLAAEHDLFGLSFRAVREAFQGGPPVAVARSSDSARAAPANPAAEKAATDAVTPRVVYLVVELERSWHNHRAPADAVYACLRDVVIPASRPAEVFLYALPVNPVAVRRPRSVGERLAASAVTAGKIADLRQAIEARQGQVVAELPAAVLLAQLALAADDPRGAVSGLKGIRDRLARDTTRTAAELACHAAIPALGRPEAEVVGAAQEVLDRVLKSFAAGNQSLEPLATLSLLSARLQLDRGDMAGGRRRLDAFLDTMEQVAAGSGVDASLRIRKQQIERAAAEYARAGLWDLALEILGRHADAPTPAGGDQSLGDVLTRLLHYLRTRSARDRFETLRAWTLPARGRRGVRILISDGPRDMAPDSFFRPGTGDGAGESRAAAPQDDESLASTAAALIDAARQAGSLDQLTDLVHTAAEQRVENAGDLELLVEMARGRSAPALAAIEARVLELNRDNRAITVEVPSTAVLISSV